MRINIGSKIILRFKTGKNNINGEPTKVASTCFGVFALLDFKDPVSNEVQSDEVWECRILWAKENKIIVQPLKKLC